MSRGGVAVCVAVAVGVAGLAATGTGQTAAARARIFDAASSIASTSRDLSIDLRGFAAPANGSRMVYLDGQGVLGRGTAHDPLEAPDCDYCGGLRGTMQLLLDAAPARAPVADFDHHVFAIVVGPLADSAPDPVIVLEPGDNPGFSVDLDGDGVGDLARTFTSHACPGAARHLGMGASACDLMEREACDAQVHRRRGSWRAFERVEHASCLMDGRRDFEF